MLGLPQHGRYSSRTGNRKAIEAYNSIIKPDYARPTGTFTVQL